MGKDKKERVKGNLQPANAQRTADLSFSTAFNSFGSSSESYSASDDVFASVSGLESVDDLVSDPDLKLQLKKLSKRDTTTRIKALDDILSYLESKDSIFLQSEILPIYPILYNKLILDSTRQIRDLASSLHAVITTKLGKLISPILKRIVPPWLLSQFDPSPNTSSVAISSFQSMFPDEKRKKLFKVTKVEIISFCKEMLINATPTNLSNPRFTLPEDMTSKYERVIVASCKLLELMLTELDFDELSSCETDFIALLEKSESKNGVWEHMQSQHDSFRSSIYSLLSTLCKKQPKLVETRLEDISSTFLSKVFSEKASANHPQMWEAIVIFTKTFPSSWVIASTKAGKGGKVKPVMPKFYSFLKSVEKNSVECTFLSLLPLIAALPDSIYNIPEFLDCIFASLNSPAFAVTQQLTPGVTNFSVFAKSYYECIFFFFSKKLETDDGTLLALLVDFAIRLLNVVVLEKYSEFKNRFRLDDFIPELRTFLVRVEAKDSNREEFLTGFFKKYVSEFKSALDDYKGSKNCQTAAKCIAELHNTIPKDSVYLKKKITALSHNLCSLSFAHEDVSIISSLLPISDNVASLPVTEFVSKFNARIADGKQFPSENFDIFVWWLWEETVSNAESKKDQWDNVMKTLSECDERRQTDLLNSLLQKLNQRICLSPALVPFENKTLDSIALKLLEKLLQGALLDVNLLANILLFNDGRSIVSELTKSKILNSFSDRLSKFTVSHLHVNKSLYVISEPFLRSIKSIFAVLTLISLESSSYRDSIINSVFQLVEYIPDGVDEYRLENSSGEVRVITKSEAHEIMNEVKEFAKKLWSRYSSSFSAVEKKEIVVELNQTWKRGFEDLTHCGTPIDYLDQLLLLISLSPESKDEIITSSLPSLSQIRSWSDPFRLTTHELILTSIANPVLSPCTIGKNQSQDLSNQTKSYDLFGISSYGRLLLVFIGLVHKFGISVLLESTTSQSTSDSTQTYLVMELFKVYSTVTLQSIPIWVESEGNDVIVEKAVFIDDLDAVTNQIVNELVRGNDGTVILEFDSESMSSGILQLTLSTAVKLSNEFGREYSLALNLLLTKVLKAMDERIRDRIVAEWTSSILKTIQNSNTGKLTDTITCSVSASILAVSGYADILAVVNQPLSDKIRQSTAPENSHPSDLSSLVLLNKVMEHNLDHTNPSQLGSSVLNSIRRWFEGSENSYQQRRLCGDIQEWDKVNAEVAKYFENLVEYTSRFESEIGVKSGEWVVTVSETWIKLLTEQSGTSTTHSVWLFNVLELIIAISNSTSDFWRQLIAKNWIKATFQCFLRLFYHISGAKCDSKSTKSDRMLQTLISELCVEVPEDILFEDARFSELCQALYSENTQVQITAYALLKRLIARSVVQSSLKVELNSSEEVQEPEKLPEQIFSAVKKSNSEKMSDNGDLGYLLSWMALLDHFEEATYILRTSYTADIRTADILSTFLIRVLQLLGVGNKIVSEFDLSGWQIETYYVSAISLENDDMTIPLLCGHLYFRALRHIPSLVRIWWTELQNRQLSINVENFTQKYFSPILLAHELESITNVDASSFENMTIKSSTTTSEITATYTFEEAKLELVIKLPSCFPLLQVKVESGSSSGSGIAGSSGKSVVGEAKWRAWLLATGSVIMAQNATIIDALQLFRKNVSLHFDGVEDCAICKAFNSFPYLSANF
ncbi:listerin E3 ubiquitin protein ligase 1 [Nowakowskiella sp. JEL0407]|nr:listerin E3 ubiquitin protein ligase 1 [Nowakowskiella sp. JEL0407]